MRTLLRFFPFVARPNACAFGYVLPFPARLNVWAFGCVFLACAAALHAQQPEWIWHTQHAANGEVRYFRKAFELGAAPRQAVLTASCDDGATVFVNGAQVAEVNDWHTPQTVDVTKHLAQGKNVVAVRGRNQTGTAALVLRLQVTLFNAREDTIVTDSSWRSAEKETAGWQTADFDASGWSKPHSFGKLGVAPWGDVFAGGGRTGGKKAAAASGEATPADALATLPGFKVELLKSADRNTDGSWINLAKDNKGRLLLGGQRNQPVTRITLKDGKIANTERLDLGVTETMGLLYAFDSLYIDGYGNAPDGKGTFGLWRCRDTDGNGAFGKPEFLRGWEGGAGEHGAHGLVVGPDKKIYAVCGNFTSIPTDLLPSSPHRNYADDLVLPRAEDGNGFGAGKKPPGGFITRMDADGKNCELFASGERNNYDIAFNADGELFGFDSDMEWDWGTPWYRPIRVFHAPSAADQGFREGTAKWPEYYMDSLPPVVNIGLGSPTGVIFGAGAKFPAKYQKAFFVCDWTYGRLIAAHLTPHGASYTGTWENFVAPKSLQGEGAKTPLQLTDVVIGDDGALYFTIGGRNTQAGLYRVSYTGRESTAPADLHDAADADARALRHKLEAFHGKQDAHAIEFAWPHSSSPDRFIRYAARIAIEFQPVAQWKDRALAETQPDAAFAALLALARYGENAAPDIFKALGKFPFAKLSEPQQLEKLRVLEVCISRQGKPATELAKAAAGELDQQFPAKKELLNRELCQVLLALGSPGAIAKTLKLLATAPTQEEQLVYIHHLRTIATGWTPELREKYFDWWTKDRTNAKHPDYVLKWFEDAGRPYGNGSSFNGFLVKLRRDAIGTLTPDEQTKLEPVLAKWQEPEMKIKTPKKQRSLVKEWTMADLEPALPQIAHGRNFARGKEAFEAVQCLLCHRFGNDGGAVGPDITAVSSRFTLRDILESIIEPSKVISEQYATTEFMMKNGDLVTGRLMSETDDKVIIRPNPLSTDTQDLKKADIKSRDLSKTSPMPPGLVNILTKDEILDLIAYLASGGRKDAGMFKK
jgi:putative heme-binding domain-containing protein